MTNQPALPGMVIREWDVELAISGPVSVANPFTRNVQKGREFWTPVTIKNVPEGVRLTIVARAQDEQSANDTAVYFVGKMLDVLGLHLDLPLHLSLFEQRFKPISGHVKCRVPKTEWLEDFELGRRYQKDRRYFSRSIAWYRKALVSEDPIDKLLAFWSALEGLGSKYARPTERTQQGIINKICDCFEQLWGDVANWKVIPGDADVVNQFFVDRNGIAHGFMDVDVDAIRQILDKLPKYRELVHTFLTYWEQQGQEIEQNHEQTEGQTEPTV